jgi:hypothetical protein
MTAKKPTAVATRWPYLKGKNALSLWAFVGANLAICLSLFITKGFSTASIDQLWKSITKKDGIIAVLMPLLTIILSGLFSDTAKARLVFWRWRHPLPGCRVFTELIQSDPRIDVPALRKKHGDFPQDPHAQNALWYRLYKEHSGSIVISEAHRIYLLTRDMTTLSAVFVVLFSIAIGLDSVGWKMAVFYSGALLAQYLMIATAARNYGVRFVLNVLAEESHSQQRPPTKAHRQSIPVVSKTTTEE